MEFMDFEMALAHHGILGQKWGVRHYQNSDGSLTPEGKVRYSKSRRPVHEDYAKAHSGKNAKYMSDSELKSMNNRLNMEKQYRQLSASEVNKAAKTFSTAMKIASTVAVVTTTGLNIYNNLDKIKAIRKK